MTKILKAKPIVEARIHKLKEKAAQQTTQGVTAKLRVILVGENPASQVYVKNKRKLSQKIGAQFELIELPSSTTSEVFLKHIADGNNDKSVTGFFVQLPVPNQLKHIDITQLISPKKDVDGFHFQSISKIYSNDFSGFIPCTPKGILALLDHYKVEVSGKSIVIIGRSFIVGKPLSLILSNMDATVTLCHSKTIDLKKHTLLADIIISAVGNPLFLDKTFFKNDKTQTVIDVGITKSNGNIVGDCDFENIKNQVHAITPVPGGVGPLTVLSLMENLIFSADNKLNT